ncbi:hypothetical protein PHL163M00_22 [Propionibacterium phage PHL163M00]|uniref:Uncharacterized protein n=4 Tax=Pahexavirus TaxID=1982251 RepID=A0A0E3DND5_9CAUD|nr:hypothetical protein PHL194M00_22 [Propionibacterium phage PHL194M00]YP_009153226.1 hypothetical protein ACQ81_gp22 [Propionibacterium phage PHL055N00]YP_009153580.1 hypothetical protein PHL117M00_22 [Propionibacterium phage PHL117M00]YP_009153896.1 hypothetical protein PHL163M00_22 [Propionibacterium phage PHL163M00]AII28783.1 hypothetical protein PHL055N00_22 [Propionibacterium phage PHL055N00]AII29512.1 hypothetical protein PHL117M00_22 [Propionibacterium phage PHL117M00]AII29872.1 hypo
MDNTHNIPYTALKTAVHRIIQQQPTNMNQLQNIVGGVANQYRVAISLDNVNLTVKEVSLDDLTIDQDTLDECSEILWDCDSAGYSTNNSNTRGIPDDTRASQEAIDWLAGIAYQTKLLQSSADDIMQSIICHRDNHKNVIGQNVLDQANDTISACLNLDQLIEDTLDDNL